MSGEDRSRDREKKRERNRRATAKRHALDRAAGVSQSKRILPGQPKLVARTLDKFIEELSLHGLVTIAAREARVSSTALYQHRKHDQEFAIRWQEALEKAADVLEQEARRRAVEGTLKPVYQQGARVGTIREYSDTLAVLLLKGRRRETFGERVASGAAPGSSGVLRVAGPLTDEAWEESHGPPEDAE